MPTVFRPGYTACRGCGREILFATDDAGVTHPLDPVPPTYVVVESATKGQFRAVKSMAYVSHFSTCPAASQFSNKGKKATAEDKEEEVAL